MNHPQDHHSDEDGPHEDKSSLPPPPPPLDPSTPTTTTRDNHHHHQRPGDHSQQKTGNEEEGHPPESQVEQQVGLPTRVEEMNALVSPQGSRSTLANDTTPLESKVSAPSVPSSSLSSNEATMNKIATINPNNDDDNSNNDINNNEQKRLHRSSSLPKNNTVYATAAAKTPWTKTASATWSETSLQSMIQSTKASLNLPDKSRVLDRFSNLSIFRKGATAAATTQKSSTSLAAAPSWSSVSSTSSSVKMMATTTVQPLEKAQLSPGGAMAPKTGPTGGTTFRKTVPQPPEQGQSRPMDETRSRDHQRGEQQGSPLRSSTLLEGRPRISHEGDAEEGPDLDNIHHDDHAAEEKKHEDDDDDPQQHIGQGEDPLRPSNTTTGRLVQAARSAFPRRRVNWSFQEPKLWSSTQQEAPGTDVAPMHETDQENYQHEQQERRVDHDYEEEDDDEESSSYVSSSVYTDDTNTTGGGSGGERHSSFAPRLAVLQWAASSVVDSVQSSYFRGRYQSSKQHSPSKTNMDDPSQASTPERSNRSTGHQRQQQRSPEHDGTVELNQPASEGKARHVAVATSQTARILSSPQALHLQSLMRGLRSHEYIMLLGRGMLGVNLKQSFLKSEGTYVDFIVKGGSADRAGVIYVGDSLVAVGDIDVRRGTIYTVPRTIASAKRPVHLILATASSEPCPARIHAVDICVAMMHHFVGMMHSPFSPSTIAPPRLQQPPRWVTSSSPNTSLKKANVVVSENINSSASPVKLSESLPEKHEEKETDAMINPDEENEERTHQAGGKRQLGPNTSGTEVPRTDSDAFVQERDGLIVSNSKGSEEEDVDSGGSVRAETGQVESGDEEASASAGPIVSEMELITPLSFDSDQHEPPVFEVEVQVEDSVEAMVHPMGPSIGLRNAFASQALKRNNEGKFSAERLSVAATNPQFRAALRHAFLGCVVDVRRLPYLSLFLSQIDGANVHFEADGEKHDGAHSSMNAMLMLYLEMLNFVDLYGVTPEKRQRQIAQHIAHKYFLPTKVGHELVPPMFDFHHLVADVSLRTLETVLRDINAGERVPRGTFLDFQVAAADVLASEPFLSFLVSDECARMRAYLHNTAPFINFDLKNTLDAVVASTAQGSAKNCFLYIIIYLLCLTDKESFGENDDMLDASGQSQVGTRITDAAAGLCAAIFIRSRLLPALESAQESSQETPRESLFSAYSALWELFISPGIGLLWSANHSSETEQVLIELQSLLEDSRRRSQEVASKAEADQGFVDLGLTDEKIVRTVRCLADELVYDYAVYVHPKFRGHKFHEWLCDEASKVEQDTAPAFIPELPVGCIKRLLRKADFPKGISSHKAATFAVNEPRSNSEEIFRGKVSAFAVVFGTSVGLELVSQMPCPGIEYADIRRYCCQQMSIGEVDSLDNIITPDEIPSTLESYAIVPPIRPKPFMQYAEDTLVSDDGWQVSFVNIMIPRADASIENGEESSLYGVSLVFQRSLPSASDDGESRSREKSDAGSPARATGALSSSLHNRSLTLQKIVESIDDAHFASRIAERGWVDRVACELRGDDAPWILGIGLVSQRNDILLFRKALVLLIRDFTVGKSLNCHGLLCLFGNFSHQDVAPNCIKNIMEPYIRASAHEWVDRPIAAQDDEFVQLAGEQLIQSLPPIALALVFVATLLEQKIVVTSCRRSILLSATVALATLLSPLKWCHLMVPRVPASLASDLLQYPAPFILGMVSDDPGIMELIKSLPTDVTLVDLDVGRVILASSLALDRELGRRANSADNSGALRSQVLYLAQSLGGVFGPRMDPTTWSCDNPLAVSNYPANEVKRFDILRSTCRDFVDELLAGTTSCCYWIEEVSDSSDQSRANNEPTVLFDEDRFFHIKNIRERAGFQPLFGQPPVSNEFALGLDDFDLIIESFLRCQSMNAYISSRHKTEMALSL